MRDMIKWLCQKSADLDLQYMQKQINPGSEGKGSTHLTPNGLSYPYQLHKYFLSLGLLDGISHFLSHFIRLFCKQTMVALIRQQRLIWVCNICIFSIKRTLGLYGLNNKKCNT